MPIKMGNEMPTDNTNNIHDVMKDRSVLALGYNDPEIRRLANELFASLCLHRNGSDT